MSPIMAVVKNSLGYPASLDFFDCYLDPMWAPHGVGDTLLRGSDLLQALMMHGIIDGEGERRTSVVRRSVDESSATSQDKASAQATPAGAPVEGAEEIITAPMDGEAVVITF